MPSCDQCGTFGEGDSCQACGRPFPPPSAWPASPPHVQPAQQAQPQQAQQQYGQQQYGQQAYQQPPQYAQQTQYGGGNQYYEYQYYEYQHSAPFPPSPREASGAWAAAVFSIIFAFLGGLLGLVFGLIAVYLGRRGMGQGLEKAEAAVQLGYIGVVLSIIMILVWNLVIL